MSNEELNEQIQAIVDDIHNQPFTGTDEEIKVQQVLYFDKYVKDNIDYGFDAVSFSMEHPNEPNPFDSAYKTDGFFKENEINGKRLAVCGSISQVAKTVFNKLGIDCDYVWGHFNAGSEQEPQYVGHRWNAVSIGDKNYMVDFTLGMVIHNMNKDSNYDNLAQGLLGMKDESQEYDYLFFNELAKSESMGGFKLNERGTNVDDLDESGHLNNTTTEPETIIPNLGTIPKEQIIAYVQEIVQDRTR